MNRRVLKAKADEFAEYLGLDFKCPDLWLTRFKYCHNICYNKLCGEAGSVDKAATTAWTEDILKTALSRFHPQDLFNADESGLLLAASSRQDHWFPVREMCWGEKSKGGITFLLSANMCGTEKYPFLSLYGSNIIATSVA